VVIRDAEHKKALALGIALFDSEELIKQEKGKVIKTYSYVGDKYW
jgi:predicted RNA-binding protein (TIGR00451 family)